MFLPLYNKKSSETANGVAEWSYNARTRIRVTGVNFSEFLITRKGNLVRVIAGNLSYQSSK